MTFNPGDKVVCTAPIHNLTLDKIYEITSCSISKLAGLEHANEFVKLKEFPDAPYLSFRFKLHKDDTTSGAPTSSPSVDPQKVIEVINYVNEELDAKSAAKNDKEKVDLSLIPRISSIEHAKAFMVGEKKYSRYNYCKGHKASQLVAAAKRHLDAWFENEEHDPVDGQHHLGSVMACCSMILRQQELGTLKDDRFKS